MARLLWQYDTVHNIDISAGDDTCGVTATGAALASPPVAVSAECDDLLRQTWTSAGVC
jgi:hypothetical protein